MVSAPSSENRLWPMYLVWMNCSRASASLSFSKMRFLRAVSMGSRKCWGSIRSMSHRFSSGDDRCMNSLPTWPVYVSQSTSRMSRSGILPLPASPPPTPAMPPVKNVRSRSQTVSP